MKEYDLIVLGAGSGNMLPEEGFGDWKVAIVEPDRFGGTCLNRGCVPSKMFVYAADVAQHVRRAEHYGVGATFNGADWPSIRDRIFGEIDPLHDKAVAYRRNNGIDVYTEEAHFIGDRTVQVGDEQIRGERIVIATGSRPTVPDWPGLENVRHFTSDDIMRIEALPASMVIAGGGYIAAEMAHIFGSLGTEVTIIARSPALLSQRDGSISARFTELMQKQHTIHLSTEVEGVSKADGNKVTVSARDENGEEVEVTADALLVATGRAPNTDRLQPEASGITKDEKGRIARDSNGRTAALNIWAFGDAANHFQLKHMANAEARVIWHNVAQPDTPRPLRFSLAPSAVFADPQTASVGATEEELRQHGRRYASCYRGYDSTAYGWAMRDESSFVKVLIDPETRLLLGAHIIGPQASILIQPLVQAMALGNTVDEVARTVIYIHPALCEVIEQALLEL